MASEERDPVKALLGYKYFLYFAVYETGHGTRHFNTVLTQAEPISTDDDIRKIEKFLADKHQARDVMLINVQPLF